MRTAISVKIAEKISAHIRPSVIGSLFDWVGISTINGLSRHPQSRHLRAISSVLRADELDGHHEDSDDRHDDDGSQDSRVVLKSSFGSGVVGNCRSEDRCDHNHRDGNCDCCADNAHKICHAFSPPLMLFLAVCVTVHCHDDETENAYYDGYSH